MQQQEEIKQQKADINQQDSDQVQLSAAVKSNWVNITIKSPDVNERNPIDIVCVIDISGSMEIEAKLKEGTGDKEDNGLTVLDIVKHAVNTILTNLTPKDRLSIVAFDNKAQDILQLTKMDKKGQQQAKKALEKLEPNGSTNLWDGLYHGLEMIRQQKSENAIQTVFLLTDGEPNIFPAEGHIPALQKYMDSNPLKCTVNTFGFGYNLDSHLLEQIAKETDGMYSFIPDCSFVGTVFVNSLANIISNYARNAILSLELINKELTFLDPVDKLGYITKETSWGREIRIGNINYGQNKDIVIQMTMPKESQQILQATLKLEQIIDLKQITQTISIYSGNSGDQTNLEVHLSRFLIIDQVRQAYNLMIKFQQKEAQQVITQLLVQLNNSEAKQNKFHQDMIKDVEGQITEAFSKEDYFQRWGQHYIPSILRAHLLQICNNFKDPGVQNYGGKLFKQVRDEADQLFCKLPAPKPLYGQPQVNVNMGSYNNVNYGCFAGCCTVKMADNTIKQVDQINKDDLVYVDEQTIAKIVCIVKTKVPDNTANLVEMEGGLLITSWHPIQINNKWVYPCSIGKEKKINCNCVYDFVLDQGHIVTINGVKCATLGHGFNDKVVQHQYFGSQLIINDLKKINGWEQGQVALENGFLRDRNNGLVIGLKQLL